MSESIKKDDRVEFKPGPNAIGKVKGTVTGFTEKRPCKGGASLLIVACDDGKERKVRPGSATRLAA
ncbi:hypothetical protein J2847_005817 [Azospirillum agricola]|uniref:hypothetical protein n=1 Tax=Azospirillum agricola TaxID=1720247 RepID=UPI001AE15FC4|nr:hypothetical protein [Azospirillum agricola]MBP2232488.1 hypothetical protein [Azospirillum agricola]